MLARLFGGGDQTQGAQVPGAQDNTPFYNTDNFKNALQLLSVGLLAKGANPNASMMDIFATNQSLTDAQKKQALEKQQQAALQALQKDMMQSPYLQDDATRGMVRDLVAAGMPEKAYDYLNSLKPKPQEPFTLTPGSKRFSASGQVLAEVPKEETKTELQRNLENAGFKPGTPEYNNMIKQYYTKSTTQNALSPTGQLNPTKTVISQNQMQIQAIDNVLPSLKKLAEDKTIPGQLVGKYLHPSAQATYEASTAALMDQLIAALKLPKTEGTKELVSSLVRENPLENRQNFVNRLGELQKELLDRRNRAMSVLGNAKINSNEPDTTDFDAMAQDAIASGADPDQVKQRLEQLKGY